MAELATNQSVERAASVLRAFAAGDAAARSLRVADVARIVALRQSTTSRLLTTLEQARLVERDASGQYRLGPDLITLAGIAVNNHPVHHAARQPAQNLAAVTGLGANVAIRVEDTVFYLCNFEGALATRPFVLMGRRSPLHATALGKCLLLGMPEAERHRIGSRLTRYTAHTITDPDRLAAAVATVARHGYATDREELALGRCCVAAPLRDRAGRVVAALSLSGPATAIALTDRELELSRLVVETADTVSSQLGHHTPDPAGASPAADQLIAADQTSPDHLAHPRPDQRSRS